MAYSETDLSAIDAEIAALRAGDRVDRVASGDKMIEYGQVKLAELLKLRDSIIASMSKANGKKTCFRMSTSKGI